jgi:hypothetical protein
MHELLRERTGQSSLVETRNAWTLTRVHFV